MHYLCVSVSTSRDVAEFIEDQTSTLIMQVQFPGAARDFSPGVNFQCRLSQGECTSPWAIIARIYISAFIKDPIVHVGVQWIMEMLKLPACTVGWVAQLCRSWLSLGKATWISHGRNFIGTIQLQNAKKKPPKMQLSVCLLSVFRHV